MLKVGVFGLGSGSIEKNGYVIYITTIRAARETQGDIFQIKVSRRVGGTTVKKTYK